LENLKELTEAVLFETGDYRILTDSIRAMHDLYASYTGIEAHHITDDNTFLPSGMAISPMEAAHCLLDTRRTVVFLRGIHKALLQLKKEFPGRKINILYAGCGPYATLLTPFTSLFSSEELAFYMLDISQVSLDSVERLYTALGLNDYIEDVICTDATTYMFPEDITMHLVISETMQRALAKEPQVPIMLRLIPQMADNTIFIPEEITVSLVLRSWEEEERGLSTIGYTPVRMLLGPVYSIGRDNCREHVPCTIQIPLETGKFNSLNLFTDVTVFNDEKLSAFNSGINLPLKIASVIGKNGKAIKFRYELSNSPKFHYEWEE